MDNTIENKAKFFALYWGQRVERLIESYGINATLWLVNPKDISINSFLELKPLSSISDEDAIEVAKILCSKIIGAEDKVRVAKKEEKGVNRTDKIVYIGQEHTNYIVTVEELKVLANYNGWAGVHDTDTLSYAIDFLRSKGYALSWMGLSVKKQIEYGWVKLKESEVSNA